MTEEAQKPTEITGEDQMPTTGIDKDVLIPLPFPMLLAQNGPFIIVGKVQENRFCDLAIINVALPEDHEMAGKPLATMRVAFGMAPEGVKVEDYWTDVIGKAAPHFFQMFLQRAQQAPVVPQKVIHGPNGQRLKVVQ